MKDWLLDNNLPLSSTTVGAVTGLAGDVSWQLGED